MPIVQVIGLGAAIRWLQQLDLTAVHKHEELLTRQLFDGLREIPKLRIFGPAPEHRGAIVSFRIEGIHPEDLANILDTHGVFTRHGHHCTMPLHSYLNIPGSTRVSFGVYNTSDDVQAFLRALQRARQQLL